MSKNTETLIASIPTGLNDSAASEFIRAAGSAEAKLSAMIDAAAASGVGVTLKSWKALRDGMLASDPAAVVCAERTLENAVGLINAAAGTCTAHGAEVAAEFVAAARALPGNKRDNVQKVLTIARKDKGATPAAVVASIAAARKRTKDSGTDKAGAEPAVTPEAPKPGEVATVRAGVASVRAANDQVFGPAADAWDGENTPAARKLRKAMAGFEAACKLAEEALALRLA